MRRCPGRSRHVDGTYLKVHGHRCPRYRAIDRNEDLLDTMLCQNRAVSAARAAWDIPGRALGLAR
ncbi:MAG: DDE-type integrase/transposase/recombinase [Janthinobacterium lividum]